nr:PREDICTED: LOW QUALITY PROTEIN: uncharacterized protein C17orf98 homolog [Apteryx mantelli mantelli]
MDKRIRALQWTQHHGGTSREGWILDVSIPMEQNRCSNRRNWAGAAIWHNQYNSAKCCGLKTVSRTFLLDKLDLRAGSLGRGNLKKDLRELRATLFSTGHFIEQVSDRGFFLADLKPLKGYNGRFGYCHNTPNLWLKSSSFGEVTIFPIHG